MTEEERRRREELRRALEQGGEQAQRIVDGISDEETRVQAQAILDRQSAAQTMRAGGGEALSLIRSMQTPEKRDAALRMYTDMTHDRSSELYDPEAMSYSEIKKSWEEEEKASRPKQSEEQRRKVEEIKKQAREYSFFASSRNAIIDTLGVETTAGKANGISTKLQALSGIAAMTDQEMQTRTMEAYLQGMQSQRSELYNPYMSGSTNSYAVKQLGQQEFTPEWMAQNRWMLEYLERDEVTGSPKKPGESSGEMQKKAYAYYLLTQDAERTEKALSQTQELLEDVRAQAERQGENFDPDMYVEMIDWDYYDVLAQMMQDAKMGTPTRLNQAAPFSIESIYGAAWAGMNGIEFSDPRELLLYAGSWENARREREAKGEPEKKGFWQSVADWFAGGNQKTEQETEQETEEQTEEPTPEPPQTPEPETTPEPEPTQTTGTMEGMLVQTLAVDPRARLGVATNAAQAEQERKRQEQEQAQAMTPAQKREAFRRGDYTFVGNEEDIKTLQSLDAQIEAVNQSIQALETTGEYVDPQTGETLTATERTIRLDRLMEDRTRIEEQKAVIAFPAESAPDAESRTDAEQTQDVGERLMQQAEQERTALMEQKDAELTDAWTRYQNGEIGQGELQSEQARLELNEQRRIDELAERERAYEMNLPHDEETREIRAKADPKWVELLYELEYAVQAGDTELENNTREQLINAGYSEMWPEEVAALEQLERDQIEFAKQRGDAWTRGVLGLPEGSELTEEDYLKAGQNEVGFFESLAEQMKTIFSPEGKEKRQQAIKLMADAMMSGAQTGGAKLDRDTAEWVWDLYARGVAGQEAGYLQIEGTKDRLALWPAVVAGAVEGASAPVTSLPAAVAGLYRAANAKRYGGGLTDEQLRAIDPTYDGMMNLSERMTQGVSEAADYITAYAVTEERAGYVQSARSIGSSIATQTVLAWIGGGLGKALSANFARTIPQAGKLAERTRKLTQDVGMAIQGYASGYQQAVQEGATADEAVGYGMAAAIISAGVERISDVGAMLTGGTADDALKGLSKYAQGHGGAARMGAQIVDAFVGEAIEEGIEAPLQAAARKAIYDTDMPLTGEGGVFDLQEIAQNALQGGIAGAVLGGAGYAINARTEGQTERIDANGRIVYDTKTQQDERNGRQSAQAAQEGVQAAQETQAAQEAQEAKEGVQAAQETQAAQEGVQATQETQAAQEVQEGVQAAQETQAAQEAQGEQEKKSRQTQIRQERMGMAMEALGAEGSSARTQQIAQRLMNACLTTKKTDELARALSESMMQDAATGEAGAKAREAQQTAQTMRRATEQASAYTQGVEKRVEAQRRVTAAWGEDVANNPTKENVNRYNQDMNELTRLHREMESARANLRAMEKKAREAVQEAQEQTKQAKRKKEQLERTARRAQEKLDGLDESQWTQAYRAIEQRIEQARAEGKSAFSVLEEYADGKMDEQIAAQAQGAAQAQQEAQGAAQGTAERIRNILEQTPQAQTVRTETIQAAPEIYQYKAGTDAQGVTGTLKGVDSYRPGLAGSLLVHERLDGTRYVVNGHHRLELARRTGTPEVSVYVIREADGVTEADARAVGAIMNISEGRGTAVDAAKIMREYDLDEDGIRSLGVSLRESVAQRGLALARLEDGLFAGVANGTISENAGVAAGEAFMDADKQRAFIRSAGRAGLRTAGIEKLRAYAAQLQGEETVREQGNQISWLQDDAAFAAAERRADITLGVQRALRSEKSVFAKVGRESSERILREAGMTVSAKDAKDAAKIADAAARIVEQMAPLAGTRINGIIRAQAAEMESGRTLQEAVAEASKEVRNLMRTGEIFNEGREGRNKAGREETAERDPGDGAAGNGSGQKGEGSGAEADGQTSFFARSARRRGQNGTRAGRVKSEQQILEGLKKEFPGITVRRMSNQPNIQDEGARYDAQTGGVRVSGHQSVMAAVHEIGHKAATEAGIVTDVTRSEDGRIERVDIRPEARNAVDAMAQRMTPEERQGYRPGNEMRQEALAVFWERWMLSDDAAREYAGPLYEQLMAGVTRKQLRALRQARADIQARENASLAQRISANIRMRSDLEKGKRKYTVGNAVSGIFDANHRAIDFDYASVQQKRKTMTRAQWRAYRRERGKNGQMLMDETDRLYLRMQALNGTGATAGFIATTQAVDPDGNPLRTADGRDVKSLAECLQDIPMTQEAMGELRAYIAIMQELDARRLAERRRQEAEETGRSEPDLATGGFYMTEYKGVTTQELEQEAARLEGLHDGVYKKALEGMVELNDAVMRAWAINTGAAGITMEHYDEIVKARPHYVPTRTGGSLDIQERRQGGTIVKSETQINRARSGDVDLVDYVQAFTENLAYVVRTAREMQAKQTIARQIDRYGGHEEFVREAHVRSQEENAKIAREMSRQIDRDGAFELQSASPDVAALILEDGTNPEAGRVIVVHEPPDADGNVRTRYFEITDQAMYDMLSRVSEKDAESAYWIVRTLGKMLKGINNTFRNTTTLYNPQFAAKNMARDAVWTAISGNHKNAADAMSAWLRASREMAAYLSTGEVQSDEMRRYAALGGLGKDAYMHGEQSERVMMRELFSDKEWNGKNIQGWAERTAQKGLDAIANFNDWAEGAQRYAQFIEGTRAGQSDLRAYIRSRDDTTDFSRRGNWGKLNRIGKGFNFFNAILQGTYDVGHMIEEGAKFDPQRLNRTMTRGVAVTMVAGMAARMIQMLLWSDEEKEKYDALAENIKAENWVLGFFGNRVLMVPKGQSPLFSIGDMLGRRIMDGMEKEIRDGGDWSSYLRHELGDDLADSMLTMIGDMNPISSSVFQTAFDLGTNTNHWGESIVPSWMEGYEARNQTDAYTSEAANLIGRLTGTSPKIIHYVIDQQLGIVGDLILNATTPGKGYSTDGIAGFGRMLADMTVKGFANKVNVASSTYDDFQEYKDFFSTMLREWDDTDGDRDRMSGKINSSLTQKEYTQAYRDAEAMQEYLSSTYSAVRKLYDAVDENPEDADALTDEIVLLQVTAMHVAESWMRRYQSGDTSVEVRIPGRGK